ncbi:MAG: putative phage abortive infection protein [Paludibacteraceae bacterium]|nr:putative phage abortive infection protein [Paludibacteraceae bacterium]
MKQNLFKYGLVMVLAMIASTELLWADENDEKNNTRTYNIVIIPTNDSLAKGTNLNELDSLKESRGLELIVKEVNIEPQHINIFKSEKIWILLIPTIIIIILILCYWCLKTKDKQIKKLLKKGEKKRAISKLINNLLSRNDLPIIGALIITVFIIVLLTFLLLLLIRGYNSSWLSEFSLARLGLIGDFSSGVLGTLVATIVAVYAIRTYRLERSSHKETSLQTVLSEMLELHKQNVKEIKIEETGKRDEYVESREAFKQMYEELKAIYKNVERAIQREVGNDPIKYAEYRDEIKQKRLAHILSYGYFFYEANKYMITKTDAVLKDLCDIASSSVPNNYRNLNRHLVLGHYYRHLYNMVNYVDQSDFSSQHKNKEKYIKIIRSQLSDYEQVLLYYDALSLLGMDWNEPLGKEKKDDMNLIGKYRLLKNCPYYIEYFGIKPSVTYQKEIKAWGEEGEMFFETDIKQLMPKLYKLLNK